MKPAVKILSLLTILASASVVFGEFSDQGQRTKEFVVMGYQGIQIDLTSGKGPYLRTLLDLLNTPVDAETKTTAQLKSLLKTHSNIMDFADQVVLLGTKAEEVTKAMAEVPVPSGPGIYTGDKLVNALQHLTRGMAVTVTLKTGEQLKGTFVEYSAKRLWIRGADRRVVSLDDILALEAPQL
jgi:hypothetical protein